MAVVSETVKDVKTDTPKTDKTVVVPLASARANPLEAVQVGWGLARDIVPSIVDRTFSVERTAEITSFLARRLAEDYQRDMDLAIVLRSKFSNTNTGTAETK